MRRRQPVAGLDEPDVTGAVRDDRQERFEESERETHIETTQKRASEIEREKKPTNVNRRAFDGEAEV